MMNMDEILRNMNSESGDGFPVSESNVVLGGGGGGGGGGGDGGSEKAEDDIWSVYVAGDEGADGTTGMTLQDFLEKREAEANGVAVGGYGMDAMIQYQPGMAMQNAALPGGFVAAVAPLGFGNANGMVTLGGSIGGRGKRRVVEEVEIDKATQQKQKRMIKNRESAARSRERKQAYIVELEALVTQLEEENARLLREEADLNKQRYQQLMEKLIPVIEKRKPARVIHKRHSMSW